MKQDEDKLSYIDDFQEILQSEVYVDLERLRILARHGVPNQLRSVYKTSPCFTDEKRKKKKFFLIAIIGSLEIFARCAASRSM
jgi:hypothetical protein